jgi:hypothetical protein
MKKGMVMTVALSFLVVFATESNAEMRMNPNVLQLYNDSDTETVSFMGHAYAGGSQLNMKDSSSGTRIQLTGEGGAMKLYNNSGTETVHFMGQAWASGSQLRLKDSSSNIRVELTGGEGELKLFKSTEETTIHLDGETGMSTTKTLKLTGGSDFSEQFDICRSSKEFPLEPGMVVVIDPDRPGKLKLSETAYDKRVAGIISGAGGVKPGVLMGQEGSVADGEHPVALSGRVYCVADATRAPIEPGDMLTTSDIPGHAMKADDHVRCPGAVIGKAMTSLENGRGLVLVLVSLQ